MRRLAVCAFVVLAAGLVLAPGALASTGPRHAALGARHAAWGTGHAAAAGVNFQRLGDTTYSISGHVLDYSGTGVAGAEVDWGWWDSNNNYNYGGSNPAPGGTDSSGYFSFPGVAGGAPNGDDLTVYYPTPGLEWMDSWSLDFSTQSTYEMQPARVNVHIANAPVGPPAEVLVGQGSVGEALSDVALTGGAGEAYALPPSFTDVVAYYYGPTGNCTAQTEWLSPGAPPAPVSVSAGNTAADTVNLDWSLAQHAYLAGPTCRHSGKPGTTVKMVLKGWPADEKAGFTGYYGTGAHSYTALVTSTGPGQTYTHPLQIGSKTPVDLYEIYTYRATDTGDSMVGLWDYFQVCTFKASASAIHHGAGVRLSGKVPAGAGYVTIYSRHKASGQPGTLAAKGWVKSGRYRIKSEKFVSGLLHPTRTTWYVAKYKGFNFSAFTSVIKVTVR